MTVGMQPYARTGCQVREIQAVENAIVATIQSIVKNPLLGKLNMVPVVFISGTDTPVNHGLGQPINGWVVIRKSATGDIYESATITPTPAADIILKSSANLNATILFF